MMFSIGIGLVVDICIEHFEGFVRCDGAIMLGHFEIKKRENYLPFIDFFEQAAGGCRQPRTAINP
jgi:hypothetical protein